MWHFDFAGKAYVSANGFLHCKNKVSQMMHMQKHMIATEKKHFYVSQRFRKTHCENTLMRF